MAKFKVGDEVKLGGGRAKVIHIESTGDFPYLVERADNRIEFCNDAELYPLLPAIPPGWTPASEPPDGIRNVRLLTVNGERDGWYAKEWFAYKPGNNSALHADALAPGEVLAWREIEPDAKVDTGWYIVTDQLFKITHAEAVEFALELAKKGKVSYIARVVEEVKYHARG